MTQIVGILNITPDSFSDGGLFTDPKAALAQADKLFSDGAALVDVGAESTRPGATKLTLQEEWQRLEPVLVPLIKKYPGRISLDTYHPETAAKALDIGDVIINDVTGMNNPAMIDLVAQRKPRCIISHLMGIDTQVAHEGELLDDMQVVVDDLKDRAKMLESKGVLHNDIILDPGIGFGKTPELNKRLLEFPRYIKNYSVMIGYSRKRFLGEHRMDLEPNLEAGREAIKAGAAYIRVHDVAGHRKLIY